MADTIYYFDITKLGKDFTGKRDISVITNEQAVLESIVNILATEKGERVMRPEFGSSLSKFLFEPLDDVTMMRMEKEIEDALLAESRIDNLNVTVSADEDENTLIVDIIFNIKVLNIPKQINFKLNKIR